MKHWRRSGDRGHWTGGWARLAVALVVLPAGGAAAGLCAEPRCSCLAVEEVADALAVSDAVFIGRVVSILEVTEPASSDAADAAPPTVRKIVLLRVAGFWKGAGTAELRVRTGMSDGDCGFPFRRGEAYLVYARGEADLLSTSACSRTALAADAIDDLITLGPPPIVPAES